MDASSRYVSVKGLGGVSVEDEMKQCCGTCNDSRYTGNGEYECENKESECYACATEHDDTCMDWEGTIEL